MTNNKGLLFNRFNPNIAILDEIAMILEEEGASFSFNHGDAAGGGLDFFIVDGFDAIVDDSDSGFFGHFIVLDFGGAEGDVIGLPLKRGFAGVDGRGDLLVDRAAIVVLEFQAVGVEDLQLVDALHVNAAIAASLSLGLGHVGHIKLDVQLEALEAVFGLDGPGAWLDGHDAILDSPLQSVAIELNPSAGLIFTQKDGCPLRRWGSQ